jgi:hypothetical protein
MILKNRPITRHYQMLQKKAEFSKRSVLGITDDDVVQNFDFEQLARAD